MCKRAFLCANERRVCKMCANVCRMCAVFSVCVQLVNDLIFSKLKKCVHVCAVVCSVLIVRARARKVARAKKGPVLPHRTFVIFANSNKNL